MPILGPYWCLYVANHSNELSTVTSVSLGQQQIQISVPPLVYLKATSHLQGFLDSHQNSSSFSSNIL